MYIQFANLQDTDNQSSYHEKYADDEAETIYFISLADNKCDLEKMDHIWSTLIEVYDVIMMQPGESNVRVPCMRKDILEAVNGFPLALGLLTNLSAIWVLMMMNSSFYLDFSR